MPQSLIIGHGAVRKEDKMGNRVHIQMNLSVPFYERLKRFCEENNLSKTAVVEQVVGAYLNEQEGDAEGSGTIVLPRITYKGRPKVHTEQERLIIGKRIYDKDLTVSAAAEVYGVSFYTARDYLRMYKSKILKNVTKTENPEADTRGSVVEYINVKIEDVGLGARTYHALKRLGINDMETFVKVAEMGTLPAIRNIGVKSLHEMYDTLKKYTGFDYSGTEMSMDVWRKRDALKETLDKLGCKYSYI